MFVWVIIVTLLLPLFCHLPPLSVFGSVSFCSVVYFTLAKVLLTHSDVPPPSETTLLIQFTFKSTWKFVFIQDGETNKLEDNCNT